MLSNAVYLIFIILAGSVTTAMAVHLWINRRIIAPDLSIVLVAGLWLWITFQIGECIFPALPTKIILYKIKFTGISIVSVAWFGFCLRLMNEGVKSDLRFFYILLSPALLFNLLSFFPAVESLVWKQIYISPNYLLLDTDPNTGYVAFNIYCISLIYLGLVYILIQFFKNKTLIKIRMVPFLFAALLCLAAGLADFFFKRELSYYRFLPLALSLSSLTVIYYLRLRYFRTIPLAQHTVNESMSDCLIIASPDNTIIYMNPVAYSMFDVPQISILGKRLDRYMKELSAVVEGIDENKQVDIFQLRDKVYDVRVSLVRNRNGRIVNKIIILRDVTQLKRTEENLREMKEQLEVKVAERTRDLALINESLKTEVRERKRAEEIIQAALEEKSVLLGELHHRVKNNLQVVSSLLKLQSHTINDPKARELFDVSVSRIRTIAMVHEKLYKSKDIARTQFDDYLTELVQSVVFSHSEEAERISVNLDIEPIHLDINASILAGLIVNELVMNSLKHAFSTGENDRSGVKKQITVSFKRENAMYVLTVSDNGKGMPADYKIDEASKLGMRIITTLVRQLSGSMEHVPSPGNNVRIKFPVTSNAYSTEQDTHAQV